MDLGRGTISPQPPGPAEMPPCALSARPDSEKGARGMTGYIQVITTTEKKDDARRIARALVEARLGDAFT